MRRGRAAHGLGAAGAAARGGTPAGLPRRPWLLALCACACLAPMRACHATAPASRGECAALASSACDDARPFPPHSGRPVRWLHVPKCGTSFANALYRYGCGQQAFDDANVSVGSFEGMYELRMSRALDAERRCYAPAGWLYPHGVALHLPLGPLDETLHTLAPGRALVGLLRHPVQRLLSAFHHGMHAPGMPRERHARLRQQCRGDAACFARFPGVAGCQAKMLLGHACGEDVPLPGDSIQQAVQRLREWFAFVGVAECFTASVCAFHRQLGGAPAEVERQHVRQGVRRVQPVAGGGGGEDFRYDEAQLGGFVDEADEAVYAEAKRLLAQAADM